MQTPRARKFAVVVPAVARLSPTLLRAGPYNRARRASGARRDQEVIARSSRRVGRIDDGDVFFMSAMSVGYMTTAGRTALSRGHVVRRSRRCAEKISDAGRLDNGETRRPRGAVREGRAVLPVILLIAFIGAVGINLWFILAPTPPSVHKAARGDHPTPAPPAAPESVNPAPQPSRPRRAAPEPTVSTAPAVADTAPGDLEPIHRLLRDGRTTSAVIRLEQSARSDPYNASVQSLLGRLLIQKGDIARGLYHLDRALALAPDDRDALAAVAVGYYKSEDLSRARDAAKRYLAMEAGDNAMEALLEKIEREAAVQDGFLHEGTAHFDIYYNGRAHGGLTRAVLNHLDSAYRRVGSDLGLYPRTPVTVILYSDRDFQGAVEGPGWAGAVYDGKIRLPVRGLAPSNARLAGILAHEFVHAVVRSRTPACASWLNEGLAMYFEQGPASAPVAGVDLRRLEPSFVAMGARQAQVAYRASHAAVTDLIDRYGLYRIRDLLDAMEAGKTFAQAFDSAMPLSYERYIAMRQAP